MNDLTMHVAAEPSPDLKRTFLERLVEAGNVMVACAQLGLPRTSVYYWKHRDPDFQRAWDLAVQVHQEQLTQDVMDTARELGLGRWVQATDEHGEPLLDDDFEPVMVLDVSHVDARILSKLIDKRVPSVDGPSQTNVNVSTTVHAPPRRPRLVRPSAAEDVVDAKPIPEDAPTEREVRSQRLVRPTEESEP